MFDAILGALGGGLLNGLFGSESGSSVSDAGAAQAQLGQNIFNYARAQTQPYVDAGQLGLDRYQSMLGLGDDPMGYGDAPEYGNFGYQILRSGLNPFEGYNFVDGVGQGDQLYDYDRLMGQYAGSNTGRMNQSIMDQTLEQYGNSILGSQLSGKALAGAMQTAAVTNARLADQYARNQLASDQASVADGRGAMVTDYNRRRAILGDIQNLSNTGLNAVSVAQGGMASGAGIAGQGYQLRAQGQVASNNAWSSAIGGVGAALANDNAIGSAIDGLFG